MPGYHVVVVMMARIAYQLAENVVIYGHAALGDYFEYMGIAHHTWPAGCFTIMSTSAQDWRRYALYYSFHPWHAMPYSHGRYSDAGLLCDAIAEWQAAFLRITGFSMLQTPAHLCDTKGFIDYFVRPMSNNTFRLSFVMATYVSGIWDFHTRFSTDYPEDIYQNMQAPLADPDRWWTLLSEPNATARTMRIPTSEWRYVPPRLQDVDRAVPVLARL
jgi:hypothetical protein